MYRQETLTRYRGVLATLFSKKTITKGDMLALCKTNKTNNNIGTALQRLGYLQQTDKKHFQFDNKEKDIDYISVSINKFLNKQYKDYTKKKAPIVKTVTKVDEMPDDYFIQILKGHGYKISKEVVKYF